MNFLHTVWHIPTTVNTIIPLKRPQNNVSISPEKILYIFHLNPYLPIISVLINNNWVHAIKSPIHVIIVYHVGYTCPTHWRVLILSSIYYYTFFCLFKWWFGENSKIRMEDEENYLFSTLKIQIMYTRLKKKKNNKNDDDH